MPKTIQFLKGINFLCHWINRVKEWRRFKEINKMYHAWKNKRCTWAIGELDLRGLTLEIAQNQMEIRVKLTLLGFRDVRILYQLMLRGSVSMLTWRELIWFMVSEIGEWEWIPSQKQMTFRNQDYIVICVILILVPSHEAQPFDLLHCPPCLKNILSFHKRLEMGLWL